MRVELPRDVDGEPSARLGGREPGHREIQATASLVRIHVAKLLGHLQIVSVAAHVGSRESAAARYRTACTRAIAATASSGGSSSGWGSGRDTKPSAPSNPTKAIANGAISPKKAKSSEPHERHSEAGWSSAVGRRQRAALTIAVSFSSAGSPAVTATWATQPFAAATPAATSATRVRSVSRSSVW